MYYLFIFLWLGFLALFEALFSNHFVFLCIILMGGICTVLMYVAPLQKKEQQKYNNKCIETVLEFWIHFFAQKLKETVGHAPTEESQHVEKFPFIAKSSFFSQNDKSVEIFLEFCYCPWFYYFEYLVNDLISILLLQYCFSLCSGPRCDSRSCEDMSRQNQEHSLHRSRVFK